MKTLITTLNAKYIHTSLAIRWLYVSASLHHETDLKEFTIKEDLNQVAQTILEGDYQVVAFACYIWNITLIEPLVALLKAARPEMIIILGGPEVMYDSQHFISTTQCDYIICGEGEEAILDLLDRLESGEDFTPAWLASPAHIATSIATASMAFIESLPSPYTLDCDTQSKKNRVLYFETSRGCPFQCQYCLSSLEKGLRFFSHDYLSRQILELSQSGAKTIKILDRSFTADANHALFVLEGIFKHHADNQQFQFEINADVLPETVLSFILEKAPAGLLRFEIGIQSTYEPTNRAVKRLQNFERLSEVVHALMQSDCCDLHLDLIAGLPYEDLKRFQTSFNDVFAFHAKELQLGFLKMLRGTSLRNEADSYGYVYSQEAPYEMISNQFMSPADIAKVQLAEDMLEKYCNSGRFPLTMQSIFKDRYKAFEWFYALGCYYESHGYMAIGYQLDSLFEALDGFVDDARIHECLIEDYLSFYKIRPKRWYQSTLTQEERKEVIHYLGETYGLNQEELFRYGVVEKLSNSYLVAVYHGNERNIHKYPLK